MRAGVVYFKVVAVTYLVFGVIGMAIPDPYVALFDIEASAGGRAWGRAFGATSIAFGVMFWMIDPSTDSKGRRLGAVGALLAFGLTAVSDVVLLLQGDLPSVGWAFPFINAGLAGFALYYLRTPISATSVS